MRQGEDRIKEGMRRSIEKGGEVNLWMHGFENGYKCVKNFLE